MVINGAGPVISKSQSRRWLLFKKELNNQSESDVSGAV